MTFAKVLVDVTRGSEAVAGSPFRGRIYYSSSTYGKRYENVPSLSRASDGQILSLRAKDDVRCGDLATLPDGRVRKILEARRYAHSLQCVLQWIPYQSLTYYPTVLETADIVAGSLNVTDEGFGAETTLLAYIEPAKVIARSVAGGVLDERLAKAYTLMAISLGDMVVDASGEKWVAVSGSSQYPVIGDYVTEMRLVD